MSGFGFGGFDLSNIGNLSDIGDRLQKFKEDVESTIDASLRTDDVDVEEEQDKQGWLGGLDVLKGLVSLDDEEEEEPHAEGDAAAGTSTAHGPLDEKQYGEKGEKDAASVDVEAPMSQIHENPEFVTDEQTEREKASKSCDNETQIVENRDSIFEVIKQNNVEHAPVEPVVLPVEPEQQPRTRAVETQEETAQAPLGKEVSFPSQPAANMEEKTSKNKKKKKKKGKLGAQPISHEQKLPQETTDKTTAPELPIKTDTPQVHVKQNELNNIENMERRIALLEETLKQREAELERSALQLAEARNNAEEVEEQNHALRRAAISDDDVKAITSEYESKITEIRREYDKTKEQLQKSIKREKELEKTIAQKSKDVEDIMKEGEKLSKKQLNMETTIKQLRARVTSLQSEAEDSAARIEDERSQKALAQEERNRFEKSLAMEKESHASQLAMLRNEYEGEIKELKNSLASVEKMRENMEKSGVSRKLREAENKCEALQEVIESLREEMAKQREVADEREEILTAEVTTLQQRCSEAEARHQEIQNKVPEATAPLVLEIELLRQKLETFEQDSLSSQRDLMSRIETLEKERDDAMQKLVSMQELEEETRAKCDSLLSQLHQAQKASVESDNLAAEERKFRQDAERALREAKMELISVENGLKSSERAYASQLEGLVSKEASYQQMIHALEEEITSLKRNQEEITRMKREENIAATGVTDHAETLGTQETTGDAQDDDNASEVHSLRKKVSLLTATKEKLTAALVLAEQRVTEGNTAKTWADSLAAEASDMRKKLAAAMEMLGEREEKIEELRADLDDMRQGYKLQLEIMADEVTKLTRKISTLTSASTSATATD